jgi:sensor c-di-GMP phosphodiesterase-like protein
LNRLRIILTAIFLALIGAIIPLITVYYLSWNRAVNHEQEVLTEITNRTINRASNTYLQAVDVLQLLTKFNVIHPCSEEHINFMRSITLENRVIDEIQYFENGLLKCTIWGVVSNNTPQYLADFVTGNGTEIAFNIKSKLSHSPLIALQNKTYSVLVNPSFFTDIIVDPGVTIIIATSAGQLISTLNNPTPTLIQETLNNRKNQLNKNHLIVVSERTNLLAIAIESRLHIYKKFKDEQYYLLPLGLIISAFIIGLVIYYSRKKLSFRNVLANAIKNHEFVSYYQPIIELKSGKCIGAESLARWCPPNGELINPALFIPEAEETGLILQLTDQIIDAVIADMGQLLVDDRNLHISINFSAQDFQTGRVVNILETKLAGTGILRDQIWIEITERGFLELDSARETIDQARKLGYVVAIDDFGTGYSCLSNLQELSLDILKIDKSFVDTIDTDSATSGVTSHIINLAKTLDMKIIAEGIEKNSQLNFLIEHNVMYGQGWLFSKALSSDDFKLFYNHTT